jgi:hypothetical protein
MKNLINFNNYKKDYDFPKIRCITQNIETPHINELEITLQKKLNDFGLMDYIKSGDKVAITGSSRGIKYHDRILKTIIKYLNNLGAKPFIIPAMGSHGGATAEGQRQLLQEYGISEETMHCPIKSNMEVVKIGECDLGYPVYLDKYAADADKIIVVNEIKSHSKLVGEVESGLSKMCLIGLGKHEGAKLYHRLIDRFSWSKVVSSIREVILRKTQIVCCVAIIHNINKEIAEIHILNPKDLPTKEPELLKRYKELTEQMPFKDIDLLIVDEIGKNIYGTGMNTNIIGRKIGSDVHVHWLFVRDLTRETYGNAHGIGLADFTTKKLVDKIDFQTMYINALTAYRTDSPKIPIYLPTDKDVLNAVYNLAGLEDSKTFRIVWIKNTIELKHMLVSEYFFNEVESRSDLSFNGDTEPIRFDKEGFLVNSKKYWFKE